MGHQFPRMEGALGRGRDWLRSAADASGIFSDRSGGLLDFFGTSLLSWGKIFDQSGGLRGLIGELCDSFRHFWEDTDARGELTDSRVVFTGSRVVSTGLLVGLTDRRVVFTESRCVSTESAQGSTGIARGAMCGDDLYSGAPYLHENFLRMIIKSELLWNSLFDRQ